MEFFSTNEISVSLIRKGRPLTENKDSASQVMIICTFPIWTIGYLFV